MTARIQVPLEIEHHRVRRHARALAMTGWFLAGVIVGVVASFAMESFG